MNIKGFTAAELTDLILHLWLHTSKFKHKKLLYPLGVFNSGAFLV